MRRILIVVAVLAVFVAAMVPLLALARAEQVPTVRPIATGHGSITVGP